ncbi:MAG: FHA domain-containing protein [Gloeomargaritaceae cyanobacterium C42_A2020_066]|nr:FHA domain-containing protein [Gloeomargaritaceae cyanobacterium C42_A2020_066]
MPLHQPAGQVWASGTDPRQDIERIFQLEAGSVRLLVEVTLSVLEIHDKTIRRHWVFGQTDRVCIGRAPDNDIVISAPVVSRHHAELVVQEQRWRLINRSRNGTYLNGEPIDDVLVSNGDRIGLATPLSYLQVELSYRRVWHYLDKDAVT